MENKRYSIVRVDNECPEYTEDDFECPFSNDKNECEICRQGRYGDTKEQLVRKVVQILFKNAPKETYQPRYVEQKRKILEVAKEIVEFLGVEE